MPLKSKFSLYLTGGFPSVPTYQFVAYDYLEVTLACLEHGGLEGACERSPYATGCHVMARLSMAGTEQCILEFVRTGQGKYLANEAGADELCMSIFKC